MRKLKKIHSINKKYQLPKNIIVLNLSSREASVYSCDSSSRFLFILELVELFQVTQTRINYTKVLSQIKHFSANFNDFLFFSF